MCLWTMRLQWTTWLWSLSFSQSFWWYHWTKENNMRNGIENAKVEKTQKVIENLDIFDIVMKQQWFRHYVLLVSFLIVLSVSHTLHLALSLAVLWYATDLCPWQINVNVLLYAIECSAAAFNVISSMHRFRITLTWCVILWFVEQIDLFICKTSANAKHNAHTTKHTINIYIFNGFT